eukprot:2531717-Pleurochrysis_carterae.AAC.1
MHTSVWRRTQVNSKRPPCCASVELTVPVRHEARMLVRARGGACAAPFAMSSCSATSTEKRSATDWNCLLYTSPSPRDGLLS